MCNLPGGVCFYLTLALTVLCRVSGQKLEILPAQPEQTKPIGKPLLLTCKSDQPDPNLISELQWRDNKGRVVEKLIYGNKRSPAMYTEVLPDSGVTLFITSLTEDMAGEYVCTANYGNTEPLKASVIVRTIYPIKWVDAPEKQYPKINQDFNVRCEVEANPAPSVDWLKDGETITTNDKYVIHPKSLLVRNVQESDDGIYTCRAAVISTGELDTRYIRVEVQIPPKIEPINDVEIVEGEQASVECRAFGKPPPSYKWIKKITKEDLSKTDRFAVNKQSGLLVINKVQNDDHTAYECEATNNAGTVSADVKIYVLVKPKIFDLTNVTVAAGKQAILICKVNGRPAPKISFRKFGSRDYFVIGGQPGNNNIIFEQKVDETKDESQGFLSFLKLNRSDDGLYECMAENSAGKTWKNGHVAVEFAPTFEKFKDQPAVFTWANRPGNLSCLAEAIPNATYEWRLNDKEISPSNVFKIQNSTKQSFLIVTPGDQRAFYTQYKCIAKNIHGTESHLIQLREARLPDTVQQVKIGSLSATTIQFEIVGPSAENNLPVRAFVVQYREEKTINWIYNKTWSVDSPYILENLEPEKTYQFKFAAFNEVGLGPWAANQQVTMSRRSAPNEPVILSTPEDGIVSSPYPDFFELRWKIPADNGEPISLYEVKFCPVKRVNGNWVTSKDSCNTKELTGNEHPECRISPLDSDTHYKVELRAQNFIGYSTPAELIVKTARGSDTHLVSKYDEPMISSAAIIGIVIAAVLVFLIVVDLSCYCCNRAGILMAICERTRKMPPDEEDPKLGREEKEPLKSGDRTPVVTDGLKKSCSVEYDGNRVQARTGEIIGKNSAV